MKNVPDHPDPRYQPVKHWQRHHKLGSQGTGSRDMTQFDGGVFLPPKSVFDGVCFLFYRHQPLSTWGWTTPGSPQGSPHDKNSLAPFILLTCNLCPSICYVQFMLLMYPFLNSQFSFLPMRFPTSNTEVQLLFSWCPKIIVQIVFDKT